MLEYREIPDTNIVELTIDGEVSESDFDDTVARLQAAIRRHGTVKILEHVRSFGGMPLKKFWHDIKFGFRNMKHFTHAAVVGDKKWVALFTKLTRPFVSGEVRHFGEADIEQAREWLRVSPAHPRRSSRVKKFLLPVAAVALVAWWKSSRSR
jgi:hypothetical protein